MYGPSPAAVEAIREGADRMHSYPKASHADLVDALAEQWSVESDQVWLGNGGDGVLDYLARAMLEPGDGVLVPEPGFAYYPMSARFHHGNVETYELSKADDFAQTPDVVLNSLRRRAHRLRDELAQPDGVGDDQRRCRRTRRTDRRGDADPRGRSLRRVHREPGRRRTAGRTRRRGHPADLPRCTGWRASASATGFRPEAWGDAYARINTPSPPANWPVAPASPRWTTTKIVEKTVDTACWAREYYHENIDAPMWGQRRELRPLCEVVTQRPSRTRPSGRASSSATARVSAFLSASGSPAVRARTPGRLSRRSTGCWRREGRRHWDARHGKDDGDGAPPRRIPTPTSTTTLSTPTT